MHVYVMYANREYSGGCMLIAADSSEEAWEIASEDYYGGMEVSDLVKSYFIENFTKPEKHPELLAVTDKPKIILRNYHFE